jgi:aspartyl-tRNA(Asn)/glutamyl-tRNA(Gln) amidotransferase subunit A
MRGELAGLSLKEASDRIRSKKVSPVDLTEACLDSIKTWNPKINAWITVMREKALEQAKTLASEQSSGKIRGPLHGIPVGVKDSIDTQGTRTTGASAVYEYRFPKEDSEVVRKLKDAGAIIIGKNNMHEFDAGSTSAVSYWGPVRNPWNLEYVAGGSSGGSAAAVMMNNCFASIATDTTGSLRQSAAGCGVVGLVGTYSRVSLRGTIPSMWSLDRIGPIARSVEDAVMVLQQIAGYDHMDIDSQDVAVPDFSKGLGMPVANFRIGMPPEFYDHLDDDVAKAIDDAIAVLNKLTKGTQEVGLPSLLKAGVSAERAAYHNDVRGVNGGGWEPSTGRVLTAGADSRATDYIKGWRELEAVRRTVNESVFAKQNVDVLVAPAFRHLPKTIEETLAPAPAAGGGRGGAEGAAADAPAGGGGRGGGGAAAGNANRSDVDTDENTRSFSGYGFPVITVPCGFSKNGMPIGLQIAAARWNEMNAIALAQAYERATEWHKQKPKITPETSVPVLSKRASEQTGD